MIHCGNNYRTVGEWWLWLAWNAGGENDEKTGMWKAMGDRGVFQNYKFWMKDLLYFLT